jgi:hypothetical protein
MWQLILALPKIIDFIDMLIDGVTKLNKELQDHRRETSVDNVQKAKTAKEQEDAFKDYLSKH